MNQDSSEIGFDMLRDAAETRLLEAKDRDPRTCVHGMFLQGMTADDIPGMFAWYATPEARAAAVVDDVAVAWAEDAAAADEARAGATRALGSGDFCADDTLDAVSDAIMDAVVLWAGTFDDLCNGDHPFAAVARGSFREPEDQDAEVGGDEKTLVVEDAPEEGEHCHDGDCCDHDPVDEALTVPITPEERDRFAEFLPYCG